jgi:DNA adenine methylase
MQYMGGKSRIARQLAAIIDCARRPGQLAWDPFCGGLSMSVALSASGPVHSSDKNPALIAMYNALRAGWEPPVEVSREEYRAARALPDTDPRKAFCGYGCSFGGKWFGGYKEPIESRARAAGKDNGRRMPHRASARSVRRAVAAVRGPIDVLDFLTIEPRPIDAVIYCDPVYRDVTDYPEVGPFDHDLFARRVQQWSRYAHVFVSEYDFPIGRVVWEHPIRNCLDGKRNSGAPRSTERLYWLPAGSSDVVQRSKVSAVPAPTRAA